MSGPRADQAPRMFPSGTAITVSACFCCNETARHGGLRWRVEPVHICSCVYENCMYLYGNSPKRQDVSLSVDPQHVAMSAARSPARSLF